MSIVRGSANGGLCALPLTLTDRREELIFSFEYEAVCSRVELSTDPAWKSTYLASECLLSMLTGAGV